MAKPAVEFIEFAPDTAGEVTSVMEELAGGSGWLTLDPAIDERFPVPEQTTLGRMVSGRGPAVPRANWVPADTARRRPEPVSVGISHGTGPDAVERLAQDKSIVVPDRWRVVGDHAKRGIVLWVPIDIPHAEVLAWTLQASAALTRIPLDGAWRAAVHRR